MGIVEQRRPLAVGEKTPDRYLLEENHRFLDQDVDDSNGGEHRHEGGEEQQRFDGALAQHARAPAREADIERCNGAQSLASRFSSSSMVMPTSGVPPKTVPFLFFSTWSHAVL